MSAMSSGELIYLPPSIWVWENPENHAFTNDVYDLLDPIIKMRLGRYLENEDQSVSTLEDIEPFTNDELLDFADVAVVPISVFAFTGENIQAIQDQIDRILRLNTRCIIILEINKDISELHPAIYSLLVKKEKVEIHHHNDFPSSRKYIQQYFSSIPEFECSNLAIADRRISNVLAGNSRTLQLGNLGLTSLPALFMEAAAKCTSIQLGHKYYDFEKRKHRFIPSQFQRNDIAIATDFSQFKELRELFVSNNRLDARSAFTIFENKEIQVLDISYTGLFVNLNQVFSNYDYLNVSGLSFSGITMYLNSVKVLAAQRVESYQFEGYLNSIDPTQLIDLDLSFSNANLLTHIPKYKNLKRLVVKSNRMVSITNEQLITDINSLAKTLTDLTIDLFQVEMNQLNLPNLKRLKLQEYGEQITEDLPQIFSNLEYLNLSKNGIKSLNLKKSLDRLQTLVLDNNPIQLIDISTLANLREFSANYCDELVDIVLSKSDQLEKLSLIGTKINDWNFLNKLKSIRYLDVSQNSGIANARIELPMVEHFGANNCTITSLENLIINPKATTVELSNNAISSIKPLIYVIVKSLRVVIDIPFGNANKLFGRQKIEATVTKRIGIHLQNNPISEPHPEVILDGRQSILRHFDAQQPITSFTGVNATDGTSKKKTKANKPLKNTNSSPDALINYLEKYEYKEVKIIVIGNPNVGKTYLSHFIKSNRTSLPQHNASTNGMESHQFELELPNGSTINARILDFGGQDYFHDTHHLFFTSDTIYLALWNIGSNRFGPKKEDRYNPLTRKTNPETTEVYPLDYWLDAIGRFTYGMTDTSGNMTEDNSNYDRSKHPDGNVIVVQTRRGKGGYDFRVLPAVKANEYLVHSLSAIDLYLNPNTNEISQLGITELYLAIQDIAERLVAGTWHRYYEIIINLFKRLGIQDLEKITEEFPEFREKIIFTLQELKDFLNKELNAKKCGISLDDQRTSDVLRFLSNRGYVFKSAENICMLPYHFTTKLYAALSEVRSCDGIVKEDKLHKVLKEKAILQVAINSMIVIDGGIKSHYIIPQHLPLTYPKHISLFIDSFSMPLLAFDVKGYIHKSIVQKLFAEFRQWLKDDKSEMPIWRSGMILKITKSNSQANREIILLLNIIQNADKRRIQISQLDTQVDYTLLQSIAKKISEIIRISDGGFKHDKYVGNGKTHLVDEKSLFSSSSNISSFILSEKGTKVRIADLRHWLPQETNTPMKKLFISYSSSDYAYMKKLEVHLKPFVFSGQVDLWHDRKIQPGTSWDDAIQQNLIDSDLVIFLVSPDFLATSYIREYEIQKVVDSKKEFVFLLLKDCNWQSATIFNASQGFIDERKELIAAVDAGNAANPDKKPPLIIGDPENNDQWMKFIRELEKRLK